MVKYFKDTKLNDPSGYIRFLHELQQPDDNLPTNNFTRMTTMRVSLRAQTNS